jgi:hypothetical protein
MIPVLLLITTLACPITPDPSDGCAGYCWTPPLPDDCLMRYRHQYWADYPPAGVACQPTESQGTTYYWCDYFSDPIAIPCECYENESVPYNQVWMKRLP